MKILKPVQIVDANFISSTVAEPYATETAWSAGTSYTVGTRVIRTTTHRVYRNLISGVNATVPELAPDRWFDEGPTNKWAWADTEVSTPTQSTSTYQQVVRPGAISDVAIFGMENVSSVQVEVWDSPGGALLFDTTVSAEFWGNGDPYVSYYFDTPYFRNKLIVSGLPADTTCEVRTTLTSALSSMSFGLIAYGRFTDLGCSEFGFSASPVDYSRIKIDDYGNNYIVKGKRARDLSGVVRMPVESANSIVETIDRLLGTPLLAVTTDNPALDYLNSFGLVSCRASADGPNEARLQFDMKGLI